MLILSRSLCYHWMSPDTIKRIWRIRRWSKSISQCPGWTYIREPEWERESCRCRRMWSWYAIWHSPEAEANLCLDYDRLSFAGEEVQKRYFSMWSRFSIHWFAEMLCRVTAIFGKEVSSASFSALKSSALWLCIDLKRGRIRNKRREWGRG